MLPAYAGCRWPRRGTPARGSGALDAVAEEEALGAGEVVEGGDEPEDEAVVEFEGRAGFAGAVTGGLRGLERGRLCSVRFGLSQGLFRSRMRENDRVPRPGDVAPWTPVQEVMK